MKTTIWFVMATLLLGLAGCSKDAEINAFTTELEATTKKIVITIDSNPTASGIEDAQKTFDSKKAGLKAKWEAIHGAPPLSAGSKNKLEADVAANMMALMDVSRKNSSTLASDPDAQPKLNALMAEYLSIFAIGR